MASRGAYDGGLGAGGKIRRRPPSRAAAASPYARPAPVPAPAAAAARLGGGDGGGAGWFSRLIASGASRLLSSVFPKPPPPLPAPPQEPERETLDAPPSLPELLDEVPSQAETLDTPPSPPPPPLEDDIPEGEDSIGAIANNSAKDGDGILRSDSYGAIDLEELLKQRTFTRSEFEYLSELLRSRTVGSNSSQPEVGNIKQIHFHEKESGSRDLPADFTTKTFSASGQVASPAELAKAYMGSRSSKGSPLRLRLHDPSVPTKSIEANTAQIVRPATLSLVPSSRMHASTTFDRLGSNYTTPNRSAIYKMSSSPYFKSAVSSRDLSGTVSSYQAPSSVHTFGRQVLKRKSTALNNESSSVGPIRKMRHRYNRVSPLLETRPGDRTYLGSRASKLDEGLEHTVQTQKRQCLDKGGDVTRGGVDGISHDSSFGQAPAQSVEMAAKILKQLDTIVPSQKEDTLAIRQIHADGLDAEDPISQKNEILAQGSFLKPSSSGPKESSLLNYYSNGTAKLTSAAIDGKTVDATSDRSAALMPKDCLEMENYRGSTKLSLQQANDRTEKKQSRISEHTDMNSGIITKEKPPAFSLRRHAPSNLVLSSEIDQNKMLASSNGFSFPIPAAQAAHSQAPPTPTLASPPKLSVDRPQVSASSSAPVTSVEIIPRVFKPVSEGSISNQCDTKSNVDKPPISSESSGRVVSFTSNPVFNVFSSKPTALSNGLADTMKSTAATVFPSSGSTKSVCSTNADSSTTSFPKFSFQSGFQTSTSSAHKSSDTEVKTEPAVTATFSSVSSLTGGSFTLSNVGTGSLPSPMMFACTTSQLSSSTISGGSAPFQLSSQSGSESSLAGQDKSKAASSSFPFSFSPQFGTTSSFAAQGKSSAASPQSTLFSGNQFTQSESSAASPQSTLFSGNQFNQSGHSNSLFAQSSTSNSNLLSSEKVNPGSSPSFANSPFGSSTPGSSPTNSSSVFSFAAGSGSTSATTASSSPDTSSVFGPSTAFSESPIYVSSLTSTTAPLSFGSLNTTSGTSPFSSTSSPVFLFTLATPTIPNASPTTPLFDTGSPTVGLSTGTDQMNGGLTGDKNHFAFSTASPFGLPSSSPSTPIVFSSPATQFASTTSASPGMFQFGQQSQASSGGFSMGTGGNNEKSGRRILKVKRKK
ncbi:hypothetical protein E2562_014755 [Oryza meyeriana var. granulata]|uniref:Nuclear pore complex protein NUP1 n=1 Tax=Oryza meyeriana var. granulata TaxID=110450 RepID=A0A6G1BJM9_9ORYZ|nr:hypothetical protein E2562_014755 [Oryza meyeriana var. granulata]KAF0888546.1 hypothetical protein E2562_014755 [Oryza meyeriana var. granulata]KAF0888547.1 hypothetical protein E2562_014755 [Oryza meyeriana var. granulata]KAF0888548.1 hypothetical protein E2562_014755 [Oryza meyeriana var. granulata]